MTHSQDRQPPEQIQQIEDLGAGVEDVQDAEQVKGGFDPQPDPPKQIGAPLYRPPVKPGLLLPY